MNEGDNMNDPRKNEAVSQIVGEMILLAIAISSVSILSLQLLSDPGPQDIANVTIIGKIENGHPVFELQRGETLEQDTKIYITVAGGYNRTAYSLTQSFLQSSLGNHLWNIGERIVLPMENIGGNKGPQVEGTVVDTKTNTIVFWGSFNQASLPGTREEYGILTRIIGY